MLWKIQFCLRQLQCGTEIQHLLFNKSQQQLRIIDIKYYYKCINLHRDDIKKISDCEQC